VVDAPLPTGGMFLWGRTAVDTRASFAAAIAAGVAYVPGDAFAVDRDGTHHVRLSFATLAPTDLQVAADRLRAAFAHREHRAAGGPRLP
jgi:2-aminoadipate transaminase